MDINFNDAMVKKTDAELLNIVFGPEDEFVSEGLEAAKTEFAKRNISNDEIEKYKKYFEQEKHIKLKKSNEPLEDIWKILTFIFPGMIQIYLSAILNADGFDRKSKELAKFSLYGFGFYVGIIILVTFVF
jgi:hypothetical protein